MLNDLHPRPKPRRISDGELCVVGGCAERLGILSPIIESMNRKNLLASSIESTKQWTLGQRLIYLSSGLAELITSEMVDALAGCNAVVLPMSTVMAPLEIKNIARSAHEVWILQGEAAFTPAIERLLEYRLQSIPVSEGEHRSVLHAPELGIVRIFDATHSGDLVLQKILLPLGESEETLNTAWADMILFAKRICSIDDSAVLQAPFATKHSLKKLPNSDIEHLVNTLVQSAKFDESGVRWVLVCLFAITVVGVVLLQALAMAGWSVPMADIYAVFFMLVGSAYFWAREHHLNERQLVYRMIAQTLEVHMLWQRASLNEPVAAHFQLRHHASLKWVRELLRVTFITESCQNERLSSRSVLESWLPTALFDNEKLANWHALRATRISWAVRFAYGLSGALTLFLVFGPTLTGLPDLIIGATLGIASSIGTLFLIFGGTLGYSANANLHRHLVQLLQQTQQALALNLPDHEYDELLIDAGRECIQSAVERAFH